LVCASSAVSPVDRVLATATRSLGTSSVSCHGTLRSGSSMHGNTRRAEIDSNWVWT